jgi:hypothetical protein
MGREESDSQRGSDDNPYRAPRAPIGAGKRRGHPIGEFTGDITQPISITHELSEDDLRRLLNFDTFYDPIPLLGVIPQWIYVLVGISSLFSFAAARRFPSVPFWFCGIIGLIAGLVHLGVSTLVFANNRRLALQAGVCEHRSATISPQGLLIETPNAQINFTFVLRSHVEGFIPWANIRKIETSNDDIIFWQKGRKRLIIPRRAFPTSTESERFFQAAKLWHSASSR